MEGTIIIVAIVAMIGCCGYILYLGGEYLYEWYIENFTTDIDPEHPEVEQKPKIDTMKFYEAADAAMGIIPSIWKGMEVFTAGLIKDLRGLFAMNEEDRDWPVPPPKQSRLPRQRQPKQPRYTYHDAGDPEHPSMIDARVESMRERLGIDTDSLWDTSKYPSPKKKDKSYWTTKINTTRKIDMMNRVCRKRGCAGRYTRTLTDDKVRCSNCGSVMLRYRSTMNVHVK